MTEEEWLSGNDFHYLLDGLEDQISERKLRLFAVACCRRYWHAIADERGRLAIETAEKVADSSAPIESLRDIRLIVEVALSLFWDGITLVRRGNRQYFGSRGVALSHDALVLGEVMTREEFSCPIADDAVNCLLIFVGHFATPEQVWATKAGDQAVAIAVEQEVPNFLGLLHDVVGNPFRPSSIETPWLVWNDSTVLKIAQAIYDDRAFDRLPILADALEDASCDNTDILNHCRQPGEHVRGCWVVDLILGKK